MVALVALVVSQLDLSVGQVGQQRTDADKAKWLQLARNAWQYFQAGIGVNVNTGLHSAGLNWPYFTAWDLGTYIQAIIEASKLGILQDGGSWGFNFRVDKILTFLKTRKLTNDGMPYLVYDSRTGEPSDFSPSFFVDEGKLTMALYNLKTFRPDLAQDIDYIVKVRPNNAQLIPDPKSLLNSTDIYIYYVALAYQAFGFEGWDVVPSSIIGTITSRPKVTSYGVELPSAHICNDPLLNTVFDVNPQDSRFSWLVSQVYLAQEARYNATGYYSAFSEGNTGLLDPSYAYEFVVDTDGSTWKVTPPVEPVNYFKVAISYDAIFNTEYTQNMVDYIMGKAPPSYLGFPEGVAEDGRTVNIFIDRTNELTIAAARYAIENTPAPTPTPTPSPSPTPTPTETPTPIPTDTPSSSPSPTPSDSFSPSPSESSSPSMSPSPTASASPTPSSPSPSISSSSSPSVSPSPSLSSIPTSTAPVGWTIEPTMLVLLVAVAAVAWLSLFIPLIILFRRTKLRPTES